MMRAVPALRRPAAPLRRATWSLALLVLVAGNACGQAPADADVDGAAEDAQHKATLLKDVAAGGKGAEPPLPPARMATAQAPEVPFCLVTHYTAGAPAFYEVAVQSHRRYAARHGYAQESFVGHISGAAFLDPARGDALSLYGGGLYWQKLAAMQQVLRNGIIDRDGVTKRCAWAMWLDSDTVITNETILLQDIVTRYAQSDSTRPDVEILLAPENGHLVSGGVFLLHNGAGGLAFLDAVADLYPLYKDLHLPEQTAMATVATLTEPWPARQDRDDLELSLHPAIVIAPHRAFNSFPAAGRKFPEAVIWQPGDFLVHLAGVPRWSRTAMMQRFYDDAWQ